MTRAGEVDGRPRLFLEQHEWVLGEGENVLGRDESATARITAVGVSRHHARIMVRNGRCTVEDLGSKNGTFLAEERILSPRALRDGDVIRLGRQVRVLFRQSQPEATETEASMISDGAGGTFRAEGEIWVLAFDGHTVRLTSAKGFNDLARLLAHPGTETHCLELADRAAELARPDAMLDERARREIHARVRELQHDIDEAEAGNDIGRAATARAEMDRIVELLAGSLGLKGRSRELGSAAERARSAVSWRIRHAIKKIAAVHPRLGRHLENAIRTGTFCTYRPEQPIEWKLR